MSYERQQMGDRAGSMLADVGMGAGGDIKDWRIEMFKVFEDKVTITKSEFEEYIKMKMLCTQMSKNIDLVDKMTSDGNFSVSSNNVRLALGLSQVEEQ